MKNNKLNIDLSFLYQEPFIRDYDVLDDDPEYFEWTLRYHDEYMEFVDFVQKSSLEDFVYLLTFAFKDEFPRFSKIHSALQDSEFSDLLEVNVYESGFMRSDIEKMILHLFLGPIKDEFDPGNREIYEQKIELTFNEKIPENGIKEALSDSEFEREIEEGTVVYSLKESPIQELRLKEKKLTVIINKEKVIQYYAS